MTPESLVKTSMEAGDHSPVSQPQNGAVEVSSGHEKDSLPILVAYSFDLDQFIFSHPESVIEVFNAFNFAKNFPNTLKNAEYVVIFREGKVLGKILDILTHIVGSPVKITKIYPGIVGVETAQFKRAIFIDVVVEDAIYVEVEDVEYPWENEEVEGGEDA